jgi:hypothetical protein
MLRTDPFDDAEMYLEMDELWSSRDQVQTELKKPINNHIEILHEIHTPFKTIWSVNTWAGRIIAAFFFYTLNNDPVRQ